MANIFTNAVKFVGSTLKQVATNDTLKDFKHANRLFVGSNFRLNPKNTHLFHVFFDVNRNLASSILSNRNTTTEIGLMVKTAELPKYTVDTKVMNSYNRPNVVQSKIKFDPITITFHDDNVNVVRNFWYDYYKFYYRDSDHPDSTYYREYKYYPQADGRFGLTRRKEDWGHYLNAIRIYSLHQKRFSEYILLNPIIRSFRHGQHVNGGDNGIMEHTMTIEYENILYNDGAIQVGDPMGFATLHYDLSPSPLRTSGGVKSIFGAGGLLDSAGSVLGDIQNQDYLSAIFKAARTVNTWRGTNLKNAAISEITGIYTREASAAIIGLVNENMRPNSLNGYNVPTVAGLDGALATKYNGLTDLTSAASLAGAAVLLNSTPMTGSYKKNPVTAATTAKQPVSRPRPALPLNPGATKPKTTTSDLRIANDSTSQIDTSTQNNINTTAAKSRVDQNIASSNRQIQRLTNDIAAASRQVQNTSGQLSDLNTRLTAAQALPPSTNRDSVISELSRQISQMQSLNNIAVATYNQKLTDVATEQSRLANFESERVQLNGQ